MAAYVGRLVSVVEALRVLEGHPEGMRVEELAAILAVDAQDLRDDLWRMIQIDVVESRVLPLSPGIAFVDGDGEWVDDPGTADRVALVGDAFDALGLSLMTAAEVHTLLEIGRALAEVDRDPALGGAIAKLEEAEGLAGDSMPVDGIPVLEELQAAIDARRTVRIVYSKAWTPEIVTRVVEPLRLALVDGIWELDAGPVVEDDIRSYLVRRIRSCTVLDDTFQVDAQRRALMDRRRSTVTVQLKVRADMVWMLDSAADSVKIVQVDEGGTRVNAEIREPVEQRLGVILAVLGPDAYVVQPPEFRTLQSQHAVSALPRFFDAS